MATNNVSEGNVIQVTLSGTVAVNSVMLIPRYGAGIAQSGGVSGDVITVRTKGIVTLPKYATSNALAQGQPCYLNISTGEIYNAPVSGYAFVGIADQDAGATTTTCRVILAPYSAEESREITLAATGNQVLSLYDFTNGKGLSVLVPNTAGLSVTFPAMSTVPKSMPVWFRKTAAAAAAITFAANVANAVVGTPGTVDADNDRVYFVTSAEGPVYFPGVIA